MIDLKSLLKGHPHCLDDRVSFRAYLTDMFPEEKLMINVLVTIYDSGLYRRISSSSKIDELTIQNFISQLESSYGMKQELARKGLQLWAEVYGVTIGFEEKHSPKAFDLEAPETQSLLNRYFSENSHKYSVGGLTINTKFASFTVETIEHGVHTNKIKLFGYEHFTVKYTVDGKDVSIYMQSIDDPDEKHPVVMISDLHDSLVVEIITILELMASIEVKARFVYAFDETIEPYMVPNKNNYYVMRNHFSGEYIMPLSFNARCIKINDLPKESEFRDLGYGQYTFSVENRSGATWGYKDMQRRNTKVLKISSPKTLDGKTEVEAIYLEKIREDVFINEHTKSVFIGSPHDYTQFQCDDLETAYKVFDYLAILFQRTI